MVISVKLMIFHLEMLIEIIHILICQMYIAT